MRNEPLVVKAYKLENSSKNNICDTVIRGGFIACEALVKGVWIVMFLCWYFDSFEKTIRK